MTQQQSNFRLFAVAPPGIEKVVNSELASLGIEGRIRPGGVEFMGGMAALYTANLWLRTAGRVLLRLGSFRLDSLKEAPERFSRYPWEIYLGRSRKVRIRVTCRKSRIYHTKALEERLIEGIEMRLSAPLKVVSSRQGASGSAQLIVVRLAKDRCTLSVDTSGRHLHFRGMKTLSVKAPLRENLAAAMLLAAGWRPELPLLDPFCGSGTILIEAALMAMRIPPGRMRGFAFQKWSNFDQALWNRILAESDLRRRPAPAGIYGFDRDGHAVATALENLAMSGLSDAVRIEKRELSQISPPAARGMMATNPPYGKRLKDSHSLTGLYQEFGEIVRERFPRWKVAMLCPHPVLQRAVRLPFRPVCTFSNGGIKVNLLVS